MKVLLFFLVIQLDRYIFWIKKHFSLYIKKIIYWKDDVIFAEEGDEKKRNNLNNRDDKEYPEEDLVRSRAGEV